MIPNISRTKRGMEKLSVSTLSFHKLFQIKQSEKLVAHIFIVLLGVTCARHIHFLHKYCS